MRAFCLLVLGLFIACLTTKGAGADIQFIRVRVYEIPVAPDQRVVTSFRVEGDLAFYIEYFGYTHQEKFGYVLRTIDLITDRGKGIHMFYTSSGDMSLDTFPPLTRDIVRLGDRIHFPDIESHSYQFTVNGDYLGHFPGYQPLPLDSGEIRIGGQPFTFPVILANETFTGMYIHEEWVIFTGGKGYGIYNKLELAEKGEAASRCLLSYPKDRVSDAAFIPASGNRAYIIYKTQQKYKTTVLHLSTTWPDCYLEVVEMGQPPDLNDFYFNPDFQHELSHFYEKVYYRIEWWGYPEDGYRLVKYQILGLEGTSAIDGDCWELYK